MSTDTRVYRFGPFELDAGRRCLARNDKPVTLPDRYVDVLLFFVRNAGRIVSKDEICRAGWGPIAVGDNSVAQVISGLRGVGLDEGEEPYLATISRKGYKLVASVQAAEPSPTHESLSALVDRYRAFMDGRASLETFNLSLATEARTAFLDAIRIKPDFAAAHIGAANACFLIFESTRADLAPNVEMLKEGDRHASEGRRLDPSSPDAWSTLAVIRHRMGARCEAIAAARKAVELEPREWRHHLRLAAVSWGGERLRAAYRTLALHPGLALAHWFANTVYIARGAFDLAREHLQAGCAAQDAQRPGGGFRAVGLHLQHALVLARNGDLEGAHAALMRELAFEDEQHIYGRECYANAWYVRGALWLLQDCRDQAQAAFLEAQARIPGHPLARLGEMSLATSGQRARLNETLSGLRATPAMPQSVDAAVVHAVALSLQGHHAAGAPLVYEALIAAEPGQAGWLLPVEPLLNVTAHPGEWAQALAVLMDRAS